MQHCQKLSAPGEVVLSIKSDSFHMLDLEQFSPQPPATAELEVDPAMEKEMAERTKKQNGENSVMWNKNTRMIREKKISKALIPYKQ